MKFLRNLLATLVGLTIFTFGSILLLIAIISVLESNQKIEIEEDSILHLKLNQTISERSVENPLGGYSFGRGSSLGILNLIDAIDYASSDTKIKGIFLDLSWFGGGFSQAQELRTSIMEFKESGKFVIAYADRMSEGSYYIGSVADSVFMNPIGNFEFNGISYTTSFFKGTLDKLGIEAQVFKVGDYKSAIEPFIRKNMSPENKEQVSSFINNIYNHILTAISNSRSIEIDELKSISSGLKIRTMENALEFGLIDGLKYSDQIENLLLDLSEADDKKPRFVTLRDYQNSYTRKGGYQNRIAVIVASGEIVNGLGNSSLIGSDKFVAEIRKARKNSRVKAIVLRINSPGGDLLASDKLWREVVLAKEAKPVISSFSTYAASGGYYMAMASDTIVANANTITGSIGIFSIIFNLSSFMEDKLGITTDVVNTGDFSDILTASRPMTEYEKSILQKSTESGYNTFITKAASGRGMAIDEIHAIASGRVWTGSQAKENGLVDVLGTFSDAVKIAAEKAGISDEFSIKYYPEQKSFFEQMMEDFGMSAQAKIVKMQTGNLYPYLDLIKKIKQMNGVQARMAWEGEFTF